MTSLAAELDDVISQAVTGLRAADTPGPRSPSGSSHPPGGAATMGPLIGGGSLPGPGRAIPRTCTPYRAASSGNRTGSQACSGHRLRVGRSLRCQAATRTPGGRNPAPQAAPPPRSTTPTRHSPRAARSAPRSRPPRRNRMRRPHASAGSQEADDDTDPLHLHTRQGRGPLMQSFARVTIVDAEGASARYSSPRHRRAPRNYPRPRRLGRLERASMNGSAKPLSCPERNGLGWSVPVACPIRWHRNLGGLLRSSTSIIVRFPARRLCVGGSITVPVDPSLLLAPGWPVSLRRVLRS